MLLVILGAGASADSLSPSRDDRWRPPLARELFDDRFHDLLRRHPGAVVLAERVRTGTARGESLEQVLYRLRRDETDPRRPGQILDLQFYLQRLLWECGARWGALDAGMSNYLTLLGDIEEWRVKTRMRVAFVTFNYDTLLEASLTRRFGWLFHSLDDYMRDEYLVLKVHGSASWMQVTDLVTQEGAGVTRERLIEEAASLKRRDEFIVAGPGTTQYALNGVVPAIAIPAEPKAMFACPVAHITALKGFLPEIERVLCIGWRGADRSLLELMAGQVREGIEATLVTRPPTSSQGAPLDSALVDCRKEGDTTWVADSGFTGPCRVVRTGFSGFVRSHLPEFLATLT